MADMNPNVPLLVGLLVGRSRRYVCDDFWKVGSYTSMLLLEHFYAMLCKEYVFLSIPKNIMFFNESCLLISVCTYIVDNGQHARM